MSASTPFLSLWYRAAQSPLGIAIRTSDPQTLKSMLYTSRQEAMDPDILSITIKSSPRDLAGEIWLVKTALDAA